MHEYGITSRTTLKPFPSLEGLGVGYSVIILAVAHKEFITIDLKAHKEKNCVIYDVKGILEKYLTDGRL